MCVCLITSFAGTIVQTQEHCFLSLYTAWGQVPERASWKKSDFFQDLNQESEEERDGRAEATRQRSVM